MTDYKLLTDIVRNIINSKPTILTSHICMHNNLQKHVT